MRCDKRLHIACMAVEKMPLAKESWMKLMWAIAKMQKVERDEKKSGKHFSLPLVANDGSGSDWNSDSYGIIIRTQWGQKEFHNWGSCVNVEQRYRT